MASSSTAQLPSPTRLVALDAFRGLTILFMVLVNDAGDGRHVYAPLEHAEWNGWTPTDVVFPSFVWIVGVSLTLSMGKKLAAGVTRGALFRQVLRRSLIIYALGLVVYAAPAFNLSTQRLLGVLQRIAICYLAAAAIYLTTKLRGQILWIAGLLTAYWLLMAFAPVPGFGAGNLDVEGNFAHYIDSIVLGAHNYHATKTWDPEGIVSTLPAIATALFGILCGHILQLEKSLSDRVFRMLVLGAALIAAAEICGIWVPINKKLWSTSFVLYMAGLDFILLSVFLWIVDIRGYQRLVKPLVIVGLNPITIYMLSELLSEALDISGLHHTIYSRVFAPLASPINASLLWALAYTGLMYLAAWGMYKKGWIVRV
jgi:predicted acyltransferase